jgi:hypothetical protein
MKIMSLFLPCWFLMLLFTPNLLSSDIIVSWVEDLRRNPGQVSFRLKFESWILSLREAIGKDHDPKIWCGKFN